MTSATSSSSGKMTGSGLCDARMMGLGTTSIRRWRTRAMLKPEREPVSYCAAATSPWFERARYKPMWYIRLQRHEGILASRENDVMVEIRKLITSRETVFSELGIEAARPITRTVGMAVIRNPFAGQFVEDLKPLFEAGAMLGERLMPELVKLLDGTAVSYGKGAIVGVAGEMEHGGACVHPMLGKPMRAAIGGGKAVIGSNVKVAAAGALLDVPLGHKDDSWSFPHFDTHHGLSGGCPSTRRNPGRYGNR